MLSLLNELHSTYFSKKNHRNLQNFLIANYHHYIHSSLFSSHQPPSSTNLHFSPHFPPKQPQTLCLKKMKQRKWDSPPGGRDGGDEQEVDRHDHGVHDRARTHSPRRAPSMTATSFCSVLFGRKLKLDVGTRRPSYPRLRCTRSPEARSCGGCAHTRKRDNRQKE